MTNLHDTAGLGGWQGGLWVVSLLFCFSTFVLWWVFYLFAFETEEFLCSLGWPRSHKENQAGRLTDQLVSAYQGLRLTVFAAIPSLILL